MGSALSLLFSEIAGSKGAPLARRRAARRRRVEETHSLDTARLRGAGAFKKRLGTLWVSRHQLGWTEDTWSEVGYVVLPGSPLPEALLLLDRDGPGREWGSTRSYLVLLEWTPCYYGGARPWFLCPASVGDDRACTRRCRVLYRPLGGPVFACRGCWQLSYRSRQLSGFLLYEGLDRPQAAANAMQRALDPRCSPRRRFRAARRMLKAEPGMERLLARSGR